MIKKNGPETALECRQLGYTGAIIAVTGNVMSHDVAEFIMCGADTLIAKPVSEAQLRRLFNSSL